MAAIFKSPWRREPHPIKSHFALDQLNKTWRTAGQHISSSQSTLSIWQKKSSHWLQNGLQNLTWNIKNLKRLKQCLINNVIWPSEGKSISSCNNSLSYVLNHPSFHLAWSFITSLNRKVMIWGGFFRLTAPAAVPACVGAESLKKAHHIVTLRFREVVNDHANCN